MSQYRPTNNHSLAGMWSRYLNLLNKYATPAMTPEQTQEHKDSFYMGVKAMYSLMAAGKAFEVAHPEQKVFDLWMADLAEEIRQYCEEERGPSERVQ